MVYQISALEIQQNTCPTLKVASFSFDSFDSDKCRNKEILETIVTTIKRYDIVLLVGLTDPDNSVNNVTNTLLHQLNSTLPKTSGYKQVISIRLDSYQYPVYKGGFMRSPFSALFLPTNCSSCSSFWLQAIHAYSKDTYNELQSLYYTFRSNYLTFGTTDGIILGNLNADCSYLSDDEFKKLYFYTDPSFSFGLKKRINSTSVYQNHTCTYDNFVFYETILGGISDIQVYNFSRVLGIDLSRSLAISKHYPIEMKIKACALDY
ncbi:Deoxyribonuclease-1-like 2 [Oopsacas minuta]|uniref:Deoxyribonuclease-1-like 2 n=1 Tax=Oopsacas minuta TaxID=111878 RepID=A0AAV7K4J5_9METZ|nr:Deoxyribonuclease-1-like 2 [Oopsacas minuta]